MCFPILQSKEELDDSNFDWTCPNTRLLFPDPAFPRKLRDPIRSAVDKSCPRPPPYRYVHERGCDQVTVPCSKSISPNRCASFMSLTRLPLPFSSLSRREPGMGHPPLRAQDFMANNPEHLELLRRMGVSLIHLKDGRVQLVQHATQVGC